MKIVSLSTSSRNGGAALVATSLANSLSCHVEIVHITQDSITQKLENSLWASAYKYICMLKRKAARLLSILDPYEPWIYKSYSIFPSLIPYVVNKLEPDIVHLHWVQGEFLSIKDISRIKAPIVWTLHDCWPFSAAEHHQLTSHNISYKNGYSELPWFSLSRLTFLRKVRAWSNSCFSTVSPSTWMFSKATSSVIFADALNTLIPNPLDLSIFYSRDRAASCHEFALDPQRNYLLVGSLTSSSDPIKGFDLLIHALQYLDFDSLNLEIVTFGTSSIFLPDKYPVTSIGFIADPQTLSCLYSAVDVTCIPSRIETHCQTAAESVACCTPVVCFNTAGNSSVVKHLATGYLAQPFDCQDFANGITSCLQSKLHTDPSAFVEAASSWSHELIAQMYLNHYQYFLAQSKSCA